eukprot:TRINITY_DN43501_c0_g1_i1.p1 TRINITY_DN43501_c0_g1~~TRINITY_DN43501_c0_g1_i1.p1  ORF type:complete len:1781 (+),score=479.10 TRINITY_DN43501_c0_g1_i1:71-5413(+)
MFRRRAASRLPVSGPPRAAGRLTRRSHASCSYRMADGATRTPKHIERASTEFTRIWDTPLVDPPLPPEHEMFQLERFWQELSDQVANWRKAVAAVQAAQTGDGDAAKDVAGGGRDLRKYLTTVHVLGDRLFHFFTHFRAHLDRNPRERLAFYSSRPAGMEDVFGVLMEVIAHQIDFDYCPRCHLRLDSSTVICGEPGIIGDLLYGQNQGFGFEGQEMEHSFWTPQWLHEYEKRAKGLWYQSLQLPFFRTPHHTALQCEGLMEVYRRTLNRGEANHFLRQCQIHGLPITEAMCAAHQEILQNTNPHSLFGHGDPGAVSPRWLRYQLEVDKMNEVSEDGAMRLPPDSYIPFTNEAMYSSLPNKFELDERGWVKNFEDVTFEIQQSADAVDRTASQRSGSSEFPDYAYEEEDLARIDHWRHAHRRRTLRTERMDSTLRLGGEDVLLSRSLVKGVDQPRTGEIAPRAGPNQIVFPTVDAYVLFDTSEAAISAIMNPPEEAGKEAIGVAASVKHGARVRARTLTRYLGGNDLNITVQMLAKRAVDKKGGRGREEDKTDKPTVREFCTHWRVILGTVLKQSSESRPQCDGLWARRFHDELSKHPPMHAGAHWKRKDGKAQCYIVGVSEGELWAREPGKDYAENIRDLQNWVRGDSPDPWQVEDPQEVDGVIIGVRDEQLYAQLGSRRVATPIGRNWQEVVDRLRGLRVLDEVVTPTEPPSWYIPFRNNWAEEELKNALRKPWMSMPMVPRAPYEAPVIPVDLHDPASYRIDDFRTKEFEDRLVARNLLGGSAKAMKGSRRFEDDSIFSVNPLGNSLTQTGYGQPQADRRDLEEAGNDPSDPSLGVVPDWEIGQLEQALRDISGRAPGATNPRVDSVEPEAHLQDPTDIRKRSKLQMSKRTTQLLKAENPGRKEAAWTDATAKMKKTEHLKSLQAWEYGWLRDVADPSMLPGEVKERTGVDPNVALHTRVHLTGKEDEWQRLHPRDEVVVDSFRNLNDYYADLWKPYDLGHNSQSEVPGNDAFSQREVAERTMSVGEKRRMASLLQRLWMRKAEDTMTTLEKFAKDYDLDRHALLAWFGGDIAATPTLRAALRDWLRDDLVELGLLDQVTESLNSTTYSPVLEPGFYVWLEKSTVQHQYELLVSAQLYRFESSVNLALQDPLQEDRRRVDGRGMRPLDAGQEKQLDTFRDILAGGEVDVYNRGQLDKYDRATKTMVPRVNTNINTGDAQVVLSDTKRDTGFTELNRAGGAFRSNYSLKDLQRTIADTLKFRSERGELEIHHGTRDQEDKRRRHMDMLLSTPDGGFMDAPSALEFLADWDEGMSMDVRYAIRRHQTDEAMREMFASFVHIPPPVAKAGLSDLGLDGRWFPKDPSRPHYSINGQALEESYGVQSGRAPSHLILLRWTEASGVTPPSVFRKNAHNSELFYAEKPATGDAPASAVWIRKSGRDLIELRHEKPGSPGLRSDLLEARRCPLDPLDVLWRHYCQGVWVPGVKEATGWAEEWVKRNPDKIEWKVASQPADPVAARFMDRILQRGQVSASTSVEGGTIVRTREASCNAADLGLASGDWPRVEAALGKAFVRSTDGLQVTYTFLQEAVGLVEDSDAPRPFEFACGSVEKREKEVLWDRLGMAVDSRDVALIKRQPINYGKLLEKYHWVSWFSARAEKLMDDCKSRSPRPEEEIEKVRKAVYNVVRTIASEDDFFFGRAGYDSHGYTLDGKGYLHYDPSKPLVPTSMSETQQVRGVVAQVIDRNMPLLRWWKDLLQQVKARRVSEHKSLTSALNAQRR